MCFGIESEVSTPAASDSEVVVSPKAAIKAELKKLKDALKGTVAYGKTSARNVAKEVKGLEKRIEKKLKKLASL